MVTVKVPGISRRVFLASAGAVAAAALTACGGSGGGSGGGPETFVAFKLSGGGRRVSNAAKANNANKLFVSPAVALANLAHPGDSSSVVSFPVSEDRWFQLFGDGQQVVDLRHV